MRKKTIFWTLMAPTALAIILVKLHYGLAPALVVTFALVYLSTLLSEDIGTN